MQNAIGYKQVTLFSSSFFFFSLSESILCAEGQECLPRCLGVKVPQARGGGRAVGGLSAEAVAFVCLKKKH